MEQKRRYSLIITYLLVSTRAAEINEKKALESNNPSAKIEDKTKDSICDSNPWAEQVCQVCTILYKGFDVKACCADVYEVQACTLKLAENIYRGRENDVDNGHLQSFREGYKYEEPPKLGLNDQGKTDVKRYGSTFNPWGWSLRRKNPKKSYKYNSVNYNGLDEQDNGQYPSKDKRYGSVFNKWNWSNKDKRYGSTFNKWNWNKNKDKRYGSVFNNWGWSRKPYSNQKSPLIDKRYGGTFNNWGWSSKDKRYGGTFNKWNWGKRDPEYASKRAGGAFDKWDWQDLGEIEKKYGGAFDKWDWQDLGEVEKRYGGTFNRWNWSRKGNK